MWYCGIYKAQLPSLSLLCSAHYFQWRRPLEKLTSCIKMRPITLTCRELHILENTLVNRELLNGRAFSIAGAQTSASSMAAQVLTSWFLQWHHTACCFSLRKWGQWHRVRSLQVKKCLNYNCLQKSHFSDTCFLRGISVDYLIMRTERRHLPSEMCGVLQGRGGGWDFPPLILPQGKIFTTP